MIYEAEHLERPEGLDAEAEHVGSIYWVPSKGDMIVHWHEDFLTDVHHFGFTKMVVGWMRRMGMRLFDNFRAMSQ